jgi:hypothetical protein
MKLLVASLLTLVIISAVVAQQTTNNSAERRVPLTEAAVALDANGASALEATLSTTALNGAADTPVTNIHMIVRNTSTIAYGFAAGLVTFYDAAGVRCGDGIFQADALAAGESFETDAPGIRIRCTPSTWRIVATSLVPRTVPNPIVSPTTTAANLVITVDGEPHPIQINRPMTLNVGGTTKTIVVRVAP